MQTLSAPRPIVPPTTTPAPAGPTVRVDAAELAFAGRTLFAGLSLHLQGGAWTCLLGPSGVGKTSLLRLIAGLQTGGTVTADGLGLRGKVALMAQQDLLLPWLCARDNVLLGHRLRGTSRDRLRLLGAQADAMLERVGLAGQGDAAPATLSGGMRQRVALARTLMEQRPIVLMDEPFSALDAITRHRLQDLAAELLAGRTVLLVTHHPLEALRLGHRIWVMAGRPALLRGPIEPAGAIPRDPGAPALLKLQADLMRELLASDRAMDGA